MANYNFLYMYKVKIINAETYKTEDVCGFCFATSFSKAVEKLEKGYGEWFESIQSIESLETYGDDFYELSPETWEVLSNDTY